MRARYLHGLCSRVPNPVTDIPLASPEYGAAGLLVQPGVRAGVQVLRLDAAGRGEARRPRCARFFSAARALSHCHAGAKKRPAGIPGRLSLTVCY